MKARSASKSPPKRDVKDIVLPKEFELMPSYVDQVGRGMDAH